MYNEDDLDVDLSGSWKCLLGHHTLNILCAEQPFQAFITKFSNYACPCLTVLPDDCIGQLQFSLLLNLSSTPLIYMASASFYNHINSSWRFTSPPQFDNTWDRRSSVWKRSEWVERFAHVIEWSRKNAPSFCDCLQ